MKYIDAEKLKKEIEKRIKSAESCPFIEAEFGAEMRKESKTQTYNEILSLINSLQHESTPSKEEIADRVVDWISRNTDFFFNGDTKEVMNEIKKLI